jgi:hypothetical protein
MFILISYGFEGLELDRRRCCSATSNIGRPPLSAKLIAELLPIDRCRRAMVGGELHSPPTAKRLAASVITLDDCVALCGLTEEQVLAIAEHEHLPAMEAAALAQCLMHEQSGKEKIRDMIVGNIRTAQQCSNQRRVLELLHVLHHFLKSYPEVCPAERPWSRSHSEARAA